MNGTVVIPNPVALVANGGEGSAFFAERLAPMDEVCSSEL